MKKIAALITYLVGFVGILKVISFFAETDWDLGWLPALLLTLVVTAIVLVSFICMTNSYVKACNEVPTSKKEALPVKEEDSIKERKPFHPININ